MLVALSVCLSVCLIIKLVFETWGAWARAIKSRRERALGAACSGAPHGWAPRAGVFIWLLSCLQLVCSLFAACALVQDGLFGGVVEEVDALKVDLKGGLLTFLEAGDWRELGAQLVLGDVDE